MRAIVLAALTLSLFLASLDNSATEPTCVDKAQVVAKAKTVAARLSRRLRDDLAKATTAREKWGVLCNLLELGDWAEDLSPDLLKMLRDEAPEVRAIAAKCLGAAATVRENVVKALAESLHDPDDSVREAAADALVRLLWKSPTHRSVLEPLTRNPQARGFVPACYVLAQASDEPGRYTSRLEPLVMRGRGRQFSELLWYIQKMDWKAANLLPAFLRRAKSKLPLTVGLVEAIRELGRNSSEARAIILSAFRRAECSGGGGFRREILFEAAKGCPDDPQVIQAVIRDTASRDATLRRIATLALGHVRIDATRLAALLRPRLQDDRWEIRAAALAVLGQRADAVPLCAASLVEMIRKAEPEDSRATEVLAKNLSQLPKEYVEELRMIAREDDRRASLYASFVLAASPTATKGDVERFLHKMNPSAPYVDVGMAYRLARVRCEGLDLLVAIAENCRDPLGRCLAIEKIGQLGPQAAEALPFLLGILQKGDRDETFSAIRAIRQILGLEEERSPCF